MQSVYLKFYLTEKQRHDGVLLYDWLLEEAKKLGVPGDSAFRAIAGFASANEFGISLGSAPEIWLL